MIPYLLTIILAMSFVGGKASYTSGSQTSVYYIGNWPYDSVKLEDLYPHDKPGLYLLPIFNKSSTHYLFKRIIKIFLIANEDEKFKYMEYVPDDIILEIKDWINLHKKITYYQTTCLMKLYTYLVKHSEYSNNGVLADMCLDMLRFSNLNNVTVFLKDKKFTDALFLNKNIIDIKSKDRAYTSYLKLVP